MTTKKKLNSQICENCGQAREKHLRVKGRLKCLTGKSCFKRRYEGRGRHGIKGIKG